MPRPRINDPQGVSNNPSLVSDPARVDAIKESFKRRLIYTTRSFRTARFLDKTYGTVPASLVRLREAIARKRRTKRTGSQLHPEVEGAICVIARQYAAQRLGRSDAEVEQCDVQRAALFLARTVNVKQGPPEDRYLRLHVEALMALVQETTGTAVMAQRDRNSMYDPYLADAKARMIFEVLHDVDPQVTEIKVGNIIRQARRKYAGKPMRFDDILPGYSAQIERLSVNFPIYFP
jgi:hypothetical protein